MEKLGTVNALSLREYDRIVEKVLGRHYPNLTVNPDIVYFATKAVLDADTKWNGTGTLEGYRTFRIKSAINSYLYAQKNKPELQPISENLSYETEYPSEIFDVAKSKLNHIDYSIVEMKYRYGMTNQEIGERMNIREDDIRLHLKHSIILLSMLIKETV